MTHLSALAAMIERGEAPLFRLAFRVPPSLNNAYVNANNGRSKSKKYKEWFNANYWDIVRHRNAFGHIMINAPVFALYTFSDQTKGDVANREKLASDLLVQAHIMRDDSLIVLNVQQLGPLPKGCMLAEIYGADQHPVDAAKRLSF